MTPKLQQASDLASHLSAHEQDELASRILDELAEMAFDRRIEETTDKLALLSKQALAEHRAGRSPH